MGSSSYTSATTPSYSDITGEWLNLQNEFSSNYDLRQIVTYRRYALTTDNITGDYDWDNYTDYTIFADIQIQISGNPLVNAGTLNEGDAVIFLPARVQKDVEGELIANEFRPQIQDEVIFYGFTYKIDTTDFYTFGPTEIYVKCYAKLRKETSFVTR